MIGGNSIRNSYAKASNIQRSHKRNNVRIKWILFITTIFLFVINTSYSLQQVCIEFLYYDPLCPSCAMYPEATSIRYYQVYSHNSQVVMNIQRDYGDKVIVKWILFFSDEGKEKIKQYKLSLGDWNSIVVNHEVVLVGGDKFVDETQLREIIDSYLTQPQSPDAESTLTMTGALTTAFSLGFFESFSPCLIVMLSFIIGYTLSDKIQPKEGFLKVMTFGAGFVSASAVLGLGCGLLFFSMPNLQFSLTLLVCFFAIIFGFNLLGLLKFPAWSKPKISKIAKKYISTFIGIFLLGFIFYFLDPCIAPIFASLAAILFSSIFLFTLFFFCIGAIIPFIGVGLFVGSISKITRKVYKYRLVFRSLSGAILIGYALYLISILTLIK